MDECFWSRIKDRLNAIKKPDVWLVKNAGLGKTAIVNGQKRLTSPSVDVAYRCARALKTSVEELAGGEDGSRYLREYIGGTGWGFTPPERVADIVEGVMKMSDAELVPIRGAIKAVLDSKDGSG